MDEALSQVIFKEVSHFVFTEVPGGGRNHLWREFDRWPNVRDDGGAVSGVCP